MSPELVHIGKSIVIKGELSGSEDLTVEGEVEGKIELRDHVLTIGANARITAQVVAKAIVVFGHVRGNLNAAEKVDIRDSGSVEGDVVSPRVAIADGAHFRGSVDMQRKESSPSSSKPPAPALSRSEVKVAASVVPAATGQLASA
jgi:cytoskeletal protein CcmA (bactofilin family)